MSNKHLCVGPGGINCTCCFLSPGSKARKLEFRRAKRRAEREAFNIEEINKEDSSSF